MNKSDFLCSIGTTYKLGMEIINAKNADYAGETDPFKNFRSADVVGVSPDRAILVRVLDKLSRVSNLLGKSAQVKDEAIEDTILDAINYLAILKAYLESLKEPNNMDKEAIESFVDYIQDVGFDVYDSGGNPANVSELLAEHFKKEQK